MLSASKRQLLQAIVRATALSGWSVHNVDSPLEYPLRLLISKDEAAEDLLVYIWNITPGGRNRPKNEYRIQITGVNSIDSLPDVKTLILGYWAENDVFAGWDFDHNNGPITGRSNSKQITEEYLLRAHTDGLAVYPKDNNEVAVAFAPGSFMNYVRNLRELHGAVSTQEQVVIAHIAQTRGNLDSGQVEQLPPERQRVARTVAELQRASDFRQRVLSAYGDTCAMCGTQLDLTEAAHIIPVKHPESTDETNNGICLCTLHHRAFDKGLIGVLPDYKVAVNDTRLNRLRASQRHGGEETFLANLRVQIILPVEAAQRPTEAMLQTALRIRNLHDDDLRLPYA